MKILLGLCIIFSMFISNSYAYDIKGKDQQYLNIINKKVDGIYKKSPEKITKLYGKIYKLLNDKLIGKENTRVYVLLNEIKKHIDSLLDEDDRNNDGDLEKKTNSRETKQRINIKPVNVNNEELIYKIEEISLGDSFIIDNIEYKIESIEKIDYFTGEFTEPSKDFTHDNPKYEKKIDYWKPKNKVFISVSLIAKNTKYIDDGNINKDDSIITRFYIDGYINDTRKNYSRDSETSVNNINSGKNAFIGGTKYSNYLNNYSWSTHFRKEEIKYASIFDVEELNFSNSYLNFGNSYRINLGFLNDK